MKTHVLITILIALAINTSQAQGILGKLKDATKSKEKEKPAKEEVKKELTPSEMATLDSANTFLNNLEVNKDSRGVSGIYYSLKPVQVYHDYTPVGWVKKFLINYEEGQQHNLYIATQYYKNANASMSVPRAKFMLYEWEMKIEKAAGLIYTSNRNDNDGTSLYKYYTRRSDKDEMGNLLVGEEYLTNWSKTIVEVEPGIFFIGEMYIDDFKPKNLERSKKCKILTVLYRADKATEAAKYNTNDAAWDKLIEVNKKIEKADKSQTTEATEMPAPKTDFKNAPTAIALKNAAQNFLSIYQSEDKLDYVYTTSEWSNIYKPTGTLAQNTLVGRELNVVIVSTHNGECNVVFASMTQDNTYTTGAFTENYSGQALYVPASSGVITIECSKARKYK
jgi:hypothetical protein